VKVQRTWWFLYGWPLHANPVAKYPIATPAGTQCCGGSRCLPLLSTSPFQPTVPTCWGEAGLAGPGGAMWYAGESVRWTVDGRSWGRAMPSLLRSRCNCSLRDTRSYGGKIHHQLQKLSYLPADCPLTFTWWRRHLAFKRPCLIGILGF